MRFQPLLLVALVVVLLSVCELGNSATLSSSINRVIAEHQALLDADGLVTNEAERAGLRATIQRLKDYMAGSEGKSRATGEEDQTQKWKSIVGFSTAKPNRPKPIAYLFGGGTASGKSTLQTVFTQLTGLNGNQTIWVDPDMIMAATDCYDANQPSALCRAGSWNWMAGEVANSLFNEAVDKKYHIILDGTMRNAEWITTVVDKLIEAGYQVSVLAISQPTFNAAITAYQRAMTNNRWVPLFAILDTHAGFSKSFASVYSKWTPKLQNLRLYCSFVGPEKTQVLAFEKGKVLDSGLYNRFLREANDTLATIRRKLRRRQATISQKYTELAACPPRKVGQCCSNSSSDQYIHNVLQTKCVA